MNDAFLTHDERLRALRASATVIPLAEMVAKLGDSLDAEARAQVLAGAPYMDANGNWFKIDNPPVQKITHAAMVERLAGTSFTKEERASLLAGHDFLKTPDGQRFVVDPMKVPAAALLEHLETVRSPGGMDLVAAGPTRPDLVGSGASQPLTARSVDDLVADLTAIQLSAGARTRATFVADLDATPTKNKLVDTFAADLGGAS